MDDRTLLDAIQREETSATGYYTGQIAAEQARALDYYYGRPFGNEEDGRSQVVSTDVADTIEGMLPNILKPFVSSDDVVKFNPVAEDDVEAAQQETDYINHIITQRNSAFLEMYQWIKTGLLQKSGVVKFWWESKKTPILDRLAGLTDDELAFVAQDKGVEIIEHSETMDPVMGRLHDVKLRRQQDEEGFRYQAVPPEEFLISRDAISIDPCKARFVQHRQKMTISAVREMGYDVDDGVADYSQDPVYSDQYQARRNEDEQEMNYDGVTPENREVVFKETYYLVDFDGDGIAERRKVCSIGVTILANEEVDDVPFRAWSPYITPFKFYGECPADMVMDIQLIKTTLLRQTMDNIYTVNNNRTYISGKVNVDDLLANPLGGYIRVDGDQVGNHVKPAEVTPIGNVTMPMVEYFDGVKENRTGFTRYNQGSDANTLNKTATGVSMIQQAANARMELIARTFAEVGLKPLMMAAHKMIRQHATKADTMELRGKWVQIDPRAWRLRKDMTVSVGLGHGNQQQQMQNALLVLNEQKQALAARLPFVEPRHVYNGLAKVVVAAGFKDVSSYFQDPNAPDQQGPDPRMQMMQQQMQQVGQAMQEKEAQLKEAEAKIREMAHKLQVDKLSAENSLIKQSAALDKQATSVQVKESLLNLHPKVQTAQMDSENEAKEQATQEMMVQTQGAIAAAMEQTNAILGMLAQQSENLAAVMAANAAPKRVVFDAKGDPVGIEPVM